VAFSHCAATHSTSGNVSAAWMKRGISCLLGVTPQAVTPYPFAPPGYLPPSATLIPITFRAPVMKECWMPTLTITLDSVL
jgi:hypothetical protein